jgi:hypothetical protein
VKARRAAAPAAVADGTAPPRQVRIAVWLMYAGGAIAALDLISSLVTAGGTKSALRKANPHWSAALLSQRTEEAIFSFAVVWVLTIGLWLIMARTNLAGRGWARIAASVLCLLDTVSFFLFLDQPSSLISKIFLAPMWAVGLVAVVLLWQPKSSAFIREQGALTPARGARR